MGNVVKLPNKRNGAGTLRRFWKRFVDYAKVGVCIVLVVFLFQTIALGAGAPDVKILLFRAGLLAGIALAGAAGVAAAHEYRRARQNKDNRRAWRKQLPW